MNKYLSSKQVYEMAMHDPFRYFGEFFDCDDLGQPDIAAMITREGSGQSEGMRELYRKSRYLNLVREAKGVL